MTITSYNQSLDRRIVHRASNASVLLTSIRECSPGSWSLGAQIPRGLLLGRTEKSRRVPLLFGIEVLRQCGLAIAHTGFEIPVGHAFTMHDLFFNWAQPEYPAFGPLEAEAHVAVDEVVERRGKVAGVRIALALHGQDGKLADGGGLLRWFTPQQYRLLRRSAPNPIDVTPRVDELPLREVEVKDGELEAVMGWNQTDPFTFDHATDHLPGMTLLQSAIAAAQHLAEGRTVHGISMHYRRFLEFDPAPRVLATTLSSARIKVTLAQGHEAAAIGFCDVSLGQHL